ncbi:MAG: cytochrome c [Siculibacillus sp.]|nr:cytochrome c [Siculibacillus sp.]
MRKAPRSVPLRSAVVLTIGLALGGIAAAAPPVPADSAKGRRLSERWCATCHLVTAEQKTASADAPSFHALASAPGKTEDVIADFLTLPGTTHSRMPDLALSRVEIDDIAAYIASLKK